MVSLVTYHTLCSENKYVVNEAYFGNFLEELTEAAKCSKRRNGLGSKATLEIK